MAKKGKMAKGGPISGIIALAVWLTGVLVSLAVGFGMVDKTLTVTTLGIPTSVTVVAGWIVVVLTLLSVILAIINRLK